MPWEHCGREVLDGEPCPDCGISKQDWTIQVERTRTFRVNTRPIIKLHLVEGEETPVPNEPFRLERADGEVEEGRLDEHGYVKLVLEEPGTATLVFPQRLEGTISPLGEGDEPADYSWSNDDDDEPKARFACRSRRKAYRFEVGPGVLRNARWSTTEARFEELVELIVDTPGIACGEEVTFTIFESDTVGDDDWVTELTGVVEQGEARASWHMAFVDDSDDEPTEVDEATGFPLPEFVFHARHETSHAACEVQLRFDTDLELPLTDVYGEPLANHDYVLTCAGRTKRGSTDDHGVLRESGVGPDFSVELANGLSISVRVA